MGFGNVLQKVREEVGLSQAQLAQQAGTSIDSLRKWEQDRALPKIDVVTRLANALGVSLDRLAYAGEKKPAAAPKKPASRRKLQP